MKDTSITDNKFNLTTSKPQPIRIICDRCNGSGRIPRYNHVEGGICFKCRGNKEIIRY